MKKMVWLSFKSGIDFAIDNPLNKRVPRDLILHYRNWWKGEAPGVHYLYVNGKLLFVRKEKV